MIIYRFMRLVFRIAMRAFFSRIEVEGISNVPDSGPLILVPNHSNALVDGLIVGGCLRRPVTLTAKSTLARNPWLNLLMRAANVIPLHRRQDVLHAADMKANASAFNRIQAQLRKERVVCLFPEGKSYSEPGIQKFKTGAARIALSYLEQSTDHHELLIVPVGLYFQSKSAFRSKAWIGFGAPIHVSQWTRAHPGLNARELTQLLEDRVRGLTLNFSERARSELFSGAADLLATQGEAPAELGLRPSPRLAEQLRLVHALQQGYQALQDSEGPRLIALEKRVKGYCAALSQYAVAPHEVFLRINGGRAAFFVLRELELMVFGLPIALWGLLTHLIPLTLVNALAGKITHEEDQFATNVIFISVILFPVFYLLQLAIAAHYLPTGWLLLYLVSVPYSGAYAIGWFDRLRGAFRRSRTYLLWRIRPKLQQRLAEEGRGIISEIRRLDEQLEADYGARA